MKLFKLGGRNCCSTVFSVDVGGSKSVMHKKWEGKKMKLLKSCNCAVSSVDFLKTKYRFALIVIL